MILIVPAVLVLAVALLMFVYGKSGALWWVATALAVFGGALLRRGVFDSDESIRAISLSDVDNPPYEEQKLVLTTDLLAPLEQRIDSTSPIDKKPSNIASQFSDVKLAPNSDGRQDKK